MLHQPPRRIASARSLLPTLLSALLLSVVGCAGARGPQQPATPPSTPVESVRVDAQEVIALSREEAERRVAEERERVVVTVTEGLDLRLWATDPLVSDAVALDVDGQGRVYVTQTSRRRSPDIDIRQHRDWMTPSLAFRTVEDRRAFLRRTLAPERSEQNTWLEDVNRDGSRDWRDLLVNKERVVRIEDTTGDGLADRSTLLLADFHSEVTDIAGGLLVHGQDIYVAASPDLWRLRDLDGDGVLDTRQAIASGFHVHIGYGGHGMSGVVLGPDGRIYWSVGDVGMNTVDPTGRRWEYPNQGTIVRSNPDGSDFEVYAAGLRNTHEFAFDEHGNLVSVDNDGDHAGETERIVYITDGQDSGWRINWQFGKYTDPNNNAYRVWMDEGMFKPRFDGQAAWFTPPVAAYDGGPAGMVYNPGTALSDRWRRHFFVADFTGTPANSRINSFRLVEDGAGFALDEKTLILTGILGTGMQFGPDGSLYIADWITGWGTKREGRIWKLDAPDGVAEPPRLETESLLADDFAVRPVGELRGLMSHEDMRVRTKAQFALVERQEARALLAAAEDGNAGLGRLHGLWGVAQLARADDRHASGLIPFLRDADAEVRAQTAKMLGDVRYAPAARALVSVLGDPAARSRFFAAEALGRIGYRPAVQPLIAMLRANDDADVYLRHAGTVALARIGDVEPIAALSSDPSRALRIAAVVALRRMRSPEVARFLTDQEEYIVSEAARAINDDGSIEAALPALARVLEDTRFGDEALLRRAINANLRVGTAEAAGRVGSFVLRADPEDALLVEALQVLGVWARPSVLDRVDGWYHGPIERDPSVVRAAVEPLLDPLLRAGSDAVKIALLDVVARLDLVAARPALLARVREDASPQVRTAALRALHTIGIEGAEGAVSAALTDIDAGVRMTALELLPVLGLPTSTAVEMLSDVLRQGSGEERQRAVVTLGEMGGPEAERVLAGLVERMPTGEVPAEIQLEVLETARASGSVALRAGVERYEAGRPANDPLAAHSALLHGGNAATGRQVMQSAAAQCTQCHSVEVAGATVGPHLAGVGARLSREELLLALVDPNARIAPGFGFVALTLRSGQTVSGRLLEETPSVITVETGAGQSTRVPRGDVLRRENSPSPMPPSQLFLDPREIRDVVEYLSTLR